MSFGEEFNEVNKSALVKWIDEMKDVNVCYIDDPTDPVLVSLQVFHRKPRKFTRYITFSRMYHEKSNFENYK